MIWDYMQLLGYDYWDMIIGIIYDMMWGGGLVYILCIIALYEIIYITYSIERYG